MSKETIKLILNIMRTEIKNKEEYLNSLKELTKKLRKSANEELIKKEILGIESDIRINEFSQDELDELITIKRELQNIINNKTIK
jgi:flagellar motor component MotA